MKTAILLSLAVAAAAGQSLPYVLIVGDSISAGYTPTVTRVLDGKAIVVRAGSAGGPTTAGIENLPKFLAERKWDVIHFNWGLHDIKLSDTDQHQVPLEQYQANLRKLVAAMRENCVRLIWATTTPVPEGKQGPRRKKGDEVQYNRAAAEIMAEAKVGEAKIATDDLYSFALPNLGTIQLPSNVHYTPAGYEQMGRQVASMIMRALIWGVEAVD